MAETAVLKVTPQQLGILGGEEYDRQLDFDLGNLAAFDPTPVDSTFHLDTEAACRDSATRITQSLFKQIFSLPSVAVPEGRLVQLPPPTTLLPRAKPIPKPKPLTAWQKFAQEKGIQKQKRSKLVWDEGAQDWKRRHGYGRGNDELDTPIIEASDKDQPGEDPFTRIARERRDKVKRNKSNEARNLQDANKRGALPATIKLSTKLDASSVRGQIAKGKAMKDDIKSASYLAGISTASLGKFDKRLTGEKDGERRLPGMRKKFLDATGSGAEVEAVGKVMSKVLRGGDEGLVNVRRAVGKHEAKKRAEKSGNDSDDDGRKKRKGRVGRVKNRRVPKKPLQPKGGVKKGAKKKR